jgi:hypothetical protein
MVLETFMHVTGNIHQIKHQIKSLGEGRVLTKMEKFNLKFGKCAQVFPGLSSLTTRFISGVSLLLLPNSISQCQDLDFP